MQRIGIIPTHRRTVDNPEFFTRTETQIIQTNTSSNMNKLANVIYAYQPKNDDELELNVGDKIEVIGFEEEGWWRGKLKGRIGVFPSNFVQVIESGLPSTQSSTTNKLNSIFGSKVSAKNSISSNSLNSNNSGNNLNNNNNNSNSNSNLIMNNTQPEVDSTSDFQFASADESFHSTTSTNDRRPKPIRGNGFGDIFAAGAKLKPLPVDPTKPTALASERLSTIANNLTSTLQKPVPKKPPPPAPAADCNPNGSSSDQAPALPPKPSNQLSPFLQPGGKPLPPTANQQASTPQVREQARVIFAYKPSNPDELAIQVGDIINVLDKNIEDVGWWKGELNGKIGVFPDNFVELIKISEDWQNISARTGSANQQAALGFTQQHQSLNTENKIKSVFAGTPKGFSKELENNLEKHGNPASFLSLKRNKIQQANSNVTTESAMISDPNNKHDNDTVGPLDSNSTKLNHITANRAKGPSRRPPSNLLNKRNQSAESPNKKETNGRGEDYSLGSLPVNSGSHHQINQESLSSLPIAQQALAAVGGSVLPQNSSDVNPSAPIKSSLSLDNVVDNLQVGPRTNQRVQQPSQVTQPDKTTASPPSRPPWMVELRKSNLEKKRDTSVSSNQDDEVATPIAKVIEPSPTLNGEPQAVALETQTSSPPERKSSVQSLRETYNPTVSTVKSISSRYSSNEANSANSNPLSQGVDSPRVSVSSANSLSNFHVQDSSTTTESSSPIVSRLNSLLNKASPPNKNEVVSQIMNHPENGSNTANVPLANRPTNVLPNSGTNSVANDISGQKCLTGQSPVIQRPCIAAVTRIAASVDQQQSDNDENKFIMSKAQYDNLLKQISNNVTNELSELKDEVKRLQEECRGIGDLKASIEAMKIELKTCQNATENQKRYIKELVNNLADERKKIAAMQGEIERNLK